MGGGGGSESTGGGKGRPGLKKTKVEIIPMIDTMFFLLVFFILSSVGVVKLQGLNVNLPQAAPSTTTPTKNEDLTVSIDAKRQIFVNGKPVGRSQDIRPLLQREVARQFGAGADMDKVSIIISAEPTVPHGIVVRCIDQARAINIKKFAIATKAEDPATAGGAARGAATTAPPGPAGATKP